MEKKKEDPKSINRFFNDKDEVKEGFSFTEFNVPPTTAESPQAYYCNLRFKDPETGEEMSRLSFSIKNTILSYQSDGEYKGNKSVSLKIKLDTAKDKEHNRIFKLLDYLSKLLATHIEKEKSKFWEDHRESSYKTDPCILGYGKKKMTKTKKEYKNLTLTGISIPTQKEEKKAAVDDKKGKKKIVEEEEKKESEYDENDPFLNKYSKRFPKPPFIINEELFKNKLKKYKDPKKKKEAEKIYEDDYKADWKWSDARDKLGAGTVVVKATIDIRGGKVLTNTLHPSRINLALNTLYYRPGSGSNPDDLEYGEDELKASDDEDEVKPDGIEEEVEGSLEKDDK